MARIRQKNTIKVIDLFAGVGGFRLGLGQANEPKKKYRFETIWSNQWEPSTKKQHASEVYVNRFGPKGHSNIDIAKEVAAGNVPNHDMLVGGFPCQDYSVARTLSHAKGLEGKKGVLWWEIYNILVNKGKKAPKYLFLENVDRLLKSPVSQRGRDFSIMLTSLSDLGYGVEWKVINAADYGFPQRRRRVYILGYKNGTNIYKRMAIRKKADHWQALDWLLKKGVFAKAFPSVQKKEPHYVRWDHDIKYISDNFNDINPQLRSPFGDSGLIFERDIHTVDTTPVYHGEKKTLGEIIIPLKEVPKEYFINNKDMKRWKYLKGKKNETRNTSSGFTYQYNEGPVAFPDSLNKPSRTIITGEGGPTPSRFKHVIKQNGKLRRLTPLELERLCGFPDDHTAEQPDSRRAFFMGNALVVGVIERTGRELLKQIEAI